MTAPLKYAVHAPDGERIATCVRAEYAAAIVGLHGTGGKIKIGPGLVVWHEGFEGWEAAESYDRTAQICEWREAFMRTARDASARAGAPVKPSILTAAARQAHRTVWPDPEDRR